MSEETGSTPDEKKGREAAEEASAMDKLTDRVSHSSRRTDVYLKSSQLGILTCPEFVATFALHHMPAAVKLQRPACNCRTASSMLSRHWLGCSAMYIVFHKCNV